MKRLGWIFLSLLCFTLCGYLYFSSNPDKLTILMAEYYYKQNNIEKAEAMYEQAFNNGYSKSEDRYKYVNLIINSPLDADAQARLVKFIKLPVNDGAKFKAETFLSELRVKIHRNYPDNYIEQTTYNQKILRWADNPITFGFLNKESAPEYFVTEIKNAFATWEHSTNGTVRFRETLEKPNIIIRFNDKKITANENEKFVVALTKPIITSNILKNMVTDYYLTSPDGKYFSQNQIYNTALHEIAHALGFMGHSNYRKNIMYLSTDHETVNNDLRKKLTTADISTIELLYDIKPDITNKKNCSGEYTKYLIIGNDSRVADAKIREAKTYITKAPNIPAGYIDLADAYIALNDYSSAIKALNKALSLADNNDTVSMIYYNLAVSYYLMDDYEQAKENLNKSGNMKNTESAKQLLAEIYCSSGAQREAIGSYEGLIAEHPQNIEYVIALTNIYVKNGQYLKARAVLKEYVKKNPEGKNNPKLKPYGIVRMFL